MHKPQISIYKCEEYLYKAYYILVKGTGLDPNCEK